MEAAAEGHQETVSSTQATRFNDLVHERPHRVFSVTFLIAGLNCAVFVLMAFSGVSLMDPTRSQLVRWGANWGPLTLSSQPWRILTSNYVHIGIFHILLNMWCLVSLGSLAEGLFDSLTYFSVYTLSGIAGSVASLWWHPSVVGAGASGAIFGLAGVVLAVLYLGKLPMSRETIKPTLKSLLTFVGYNLFFGLKPGIDNSAHIGGLVTGLLLGVVIARSSDEPRQVSSMAKFAMATLFVGLLSVVMTLRKDAVQLQGSELDPDALPKGFTAYKEKRYEEAMRELAIAAKQDPKSWMTQFLLGSAYLDAHRPDDALRAFQAAARLKPDSAEVQIGLGSAYAALGRTQESEGAFRNATALK